MQLLTKCLAIGGLALLQLTAVAQRPRVSGPLAELVDQKDSVLLQQKLQQLENSKEEKDLLLLSSYYRYTMNGPKVEALEKMAEKRFPNGEAAFGNALGVIYDEQNGPANEKNYAAFFKRFGNIQALKGHRFFDFAKYYVANSFVNEDTAKVRQWIEKITDTVYRTRAYSYGCRELMGVGKYPAAETLIRRSVTDMERRGQDTAREYFDYVKALANVLLKNKKYQEGYGYAAMALEHGNSADKELREIFLNLQVGTKLYKAALPGMAASVAGGAASTLVREELKNAYLAVYGGESGFTAFADSLKAISKNTLRQEMKAQTGSDMAYDFVLKDLNGKTVSLADYKGKVVILDFWATWCAPCKASFPDMQRSVNKYSKDKDVAFFFVHTFEKNENPVKDAADFIKDKQYTFQVLMDLKDEATKSNKVAAGFNIKGIPTKIIIDRQGLVRFRQVGFSKKDEAFQEEMDYMIETAKSDS
ncbi:MAG: TlpA disulfide reductase family protein [Candidatus Pseudobacter hemicellulosilyticus]|uniref:TlpA disulfide reductase family protein n=1 Tax=Candidatus Pseudobacter hemicellulosilyticus TaxID=3121375 RepID=A0AAJ6BJ67_9BACT|nr:MAG: TlpA disulfide reductase family protein [Pseudobacter sp.]